jgi:hypothetical protein
LKTREKIINVCNDSFIIGVDGERPFRKPAERAEADIDVLS